MTSEAVLPSPENSGWAGERQLESGSTEFNAQVFLIQQLISKVNTATLVRVTAVTNSGGVASVGFVDVHPMVNQIDGYKNATPHGIISGVPYFRMQGGANAVILDPQVGDIGIAVFGDHDLSTVKATKADANPGSFRRFDMADALYLGGLLNGVPSQFVRFSTDGVEVLSPSRVRVVAPLIELDGDVRATGYVIAGYGGANQVGLQTHTHTQGNDSHGDSEQPTNAPTPGS
jgi:hypothetical protein